jgi:MFS family permease
MRWVGYALAAVGLQLVLLAASPTLWFFIVVGFTTSFTAGIFLAPLLTVQALVSPARVRSLSFSFVSIFLVLGGALFFISPLGTISDRYGIRWGIFSAAPCWIIAGLIVTSAAKFVAADTAKAFAPPDPAAASEPV